MTGRRPQRAGTPENIHHRSQFAVFPNQCARLKESEIKRGEIEKSSCLGIGIEIDLEASIQKESIDHIGADSAADSVGSFEHPDAASGFMEPHRTTQSGQTGPDDKDFRIGIGWGGDGRHGLAG